MLITDGDDFEGGSDHGSSETVKVGRWTRAEWEGSGEGTCPITNYGALGISPREFCFTYRCSLTSAFLRKKCLF